MRNIAPMGSKERCILWSLIPCRCYGRIRTAVLLVLAVATAPVAADDPAADEQPLELPAGGVTIRLELQPSAPESDTEKPVVSDSVVEKPTAEKSTAEKSIAEKSIATGTIAEKPTAEASIVTRQASNPLAKPLAAASVSNKTSVGTQLEQSLTSSKTLSDPPLSLPAVSNVGSSREAISSSAKKSAALLDRDYSNERTESEQSSPLELELKPDDVPLEHEEHPYDAPAARSNSDPVEAHRSTAENDRAEVAEIPFSQRELHIQAGIQATLNYYLTHPENTTRRGPWALMHALLPLGVESEVMAGSRRVNTIGWLCFNGTSGKQNMFQPTRTGFRPNVGPGVQGHEGQFLAILAQSRVPANYPLQINRRQYTVMDLAHYEMATCREKSELTFKLIGLSYYLEPNQQWRDNRGRIWSLEKMVAEEIAQPINGAACGGVHRLMGLSYSLIERQAAGEPITGHWERSKVYINDYVNYTMSLQNPDGSFSTNWLESRGMDPKVERKVQTTGHILEWLVYTLPDDHLRSPRVLAAMEFLLNTVGREPQQDWPIGPRGHALRAMALYSQRVFGAEVGQLKSYVAELSNAPLRR